jgi:BspA type Leucine rich repeat region (6 copies)
VPSADPSEKPSEGPTQVPSEGPTCIPSVLPSSPTEAPNDYFVCDFSLLDAYLCCDDHPKVTFASDVTEIPDYAFIYYFDQPEYSGICNFLTHVIIPSTVTSIGVGAFIDCISLQSVVIGNNVQTIFSAAFYNAPITTISIPYSVKTIQSQAFGNTRLTSVVVPGSVTSLAGNAFSNSLGTSVVVYTAAPTFSPV